MKEPTKPEQLTLTYKDGQWTDQCGRKAVNPEDIRLEPQQWLHKEEGVEWPGTYEVIMEWNTLRTFKTETGIKLIPPTGSENSAHGYTEGSEPSTPFGHYMKTVQSTAMVSGSVPEKSDNELIAQLKEENQNLKLVIKSAIREWEDASQRAHEEILRLKRFLKS